MAFLRDLQFAARQLRAAPGYTLAAVTTLALAIGASTAIFSAVYAVLLKPMPIRQPEQLAVAWGGSPALAMRVIELSYLDIRDMGEAAPRVGKVASVGSSAWNTVLDGEGEPVRLAAFGVSGTFFEVMGAAPHLGRMLGPQDDIAERAAGRRAQPRHVAPAIRRRPRHRRPQDPAGRSDERSRRRDARRLRLSARRAAVDADRADPGHDSKDLQSRSAPQHRPALPGGAPQRRRDAGTGGR